MKRSSPLPVLSLGPGRPGLAAALLIAALSCGCGPSGQGSVEGRVTVEGGAPLVGARVVFRSQEAGATASGVTDADGRYQLAASGAEAGVPPAEYQVAIIESLGDWDAPKPRAAAARFAELQTSGLTVKVAAGERLTKDFELPKE